MKNKIKNAILLCSGAAVFAILATIVLYQCFPQLLYTVVYDVRQSDLYEKDVIEVAPGTTYTEIFSPEQPFVQAIGIHVSRKATEDKVIGRLYDEGGRLLGEDSFLLSDVDYQFAFKKKLDTAKTYRLEIIFAEDNENSLMVTFGPEGIGPSEHISFQNDDQSSDRSAEEILYMEYVYGTYSKKLLALWALVFFISGLVVGETVMSQAQFFRKTDTMLRMQANR